MRRKILITAIAMALIAAMLTGCGSAAATGKEIKEAASEKLEESTREDDGETAEDEASGGAVTATPEAVASAEGADTEPAGTEPASGSIEDAAEAAAETNPTSKKAQETKKSASVHTASATKADRTNGSTGTKSGSTSGSNAGARSSTPVPTTTKPATPAHAHDWQPVYAKRLVKEAWTETVEKKYTAYEQHDISKYPDKDGNTIDLTALYREWYASGVWKNYPRIDKYTQMDIDEGYCNPDLIPELGSYNWFCNYMPADKLPLEVPANWNGDAFDWWFCVTKNWYSADVPVERTTTETVQHPAEYEDYVSGYACSCGATK